MSIRDEFSGDETEIRSGFDEAMKAVKASRFCGKKIPEKPTSFANMLRAKIVEETEKNSKDIAKWSHCADSDLSKQVWFDSRDDTLADVMQWITDLESA